MESKINENEDNLIKEIDNFKIEPFKSKENTFLLTAINKNKLNNNELFKKNSNDLDLNKMIDKTIQIVDKKNIEIKPNEEETELKQINQVNSNLNNSIISNISKFRLKNLEKSEDKLNISNISKISKHSKNQDVNGNNIYMNVNTNTKYFDEKLLKTQNTLENINLINDLVRKEKNCDQESDKTLTLHNNIKQNDLNLENENYIIKNQTSENYQINEVKIYKEDEIISNPINNEKYKNENVDKKYFEINKEDKNNDEINYQINEVNKKNPDEFIKYPINEEQIQNGDYQNNPENKEKITKQNSDQYNEENIISEKNKLIENKLNSNNLLNIINHKTNNSNNLTNNNIKENYINDNIDLDKNFQELNGSSKEKNDNLIKNVVFSNQDLIKISEDLDIELNTNKNTDNNIDFKKDRMRAARESIKSIGSPKQMKKRGSHDNVF